MSRVAGLHAAADYHEAQAAEVRGRKTGSAVGLVDSALEGIACVHDTSAAHFRALAAMPAPASSSDDRAKVIEECAKVAHAEARRLEAVASERSKNGLAGFSVDTPLACSMKLDQVVEAIRALATDEARHADR